MFIGLACSFLLTFHIDTSWYRNNCASFGANSTISNLPSLTSIDSNDLFAVVDTSASQTKNITFSNATGSMATFLNNTYSLKAGSASIVTVGTITSGTWNGSVLTVPYGGTASTSLSANQLFAGNGVSAVQSIAWGTSGQFLKSNGPGVLPSFQTSSIDQTANYIWSGSHTFNATTTIAASSTSANALVLDGLAYKFPSVRGASSTVLKEDGTGDLKWYPVQSQVLYKSTGSSTVSSAATTTVATVTVPANVMGANGTLRFTTIVGGSTGNEKRFEVTYGNGSASTTVFQGSVALGNNREALNGIIANVGTTSDQHTVATMTQGTASVGTQYTVTTKGVQNGGNFDTTQKTYIAFRCSEDTAAACSYKSILVELLNQ